MDDHNIPPELREMGDRVAQGQRPEVSIRTLLSWFSTDWRRKRTVREIDYALEALGLQTEPHFNAVPYNSRVAVLRSGRSTTSAAAGPIFLDRNDEPADSSRSADTAVPRVTSVDPTYRIGRLEIANRPPTCAKPDTTVMEATTRMLMRDFSQLPVMSGERTVRGLFSWKSFGRQISQGRTCNVVQDALDPHCEVKGTASLFEAIPLIEQHDCILVRDRENRVTGIMTPYDITVTFGQLAEPFLVLGEIENHIRNLIRRGNFSRQQLASNRDPRDPVREIEDIEDLTFGEYLRLLQGPERWGSLGLQIDRTLFVEALDEVRRIRNDVMHFDPDGTNGKDLQTLRDFCNFLRKSGEDEVQTV